MQKTDTITLLAIDDKPDNLTTLSAVVREVLPQTRVLTATNGPAGIELAAVEDPDLILLDIVMPGMDGFEVCRRLKADDRIKEIPVVFLTALKTDAASRVKALEVGAEGFLSKPLETAELTAQIRAMAKVKAASRNKWTEKEQLETLVAERTRDLRASEERFKVAQDISPDGFTILHPVRDETSKIIDFTWIYENQTIAGINGTDPRNVVGKRLLDVFPTHELTKIFEAYVNVANTGNPQTIEEVYVGEIISKPTWLRLVVVSLGEDVAVLAHDITERKRMDESLRKSESMFKKVFEVLPIGLWIADKNGRLIQGNPAGVKIWGQEPKVSQSEYSIFKAWRLPAREEIAPEDWALVHTVNKGVTIVDELLEIEAFDGKRKIILNYTAPILDNNREIEGVVVVNQDITERKKAEDMLEVSVSQLRAITDSAHEAIIMMNSRGLITFWNPSAEQILGYRVEEALGKNLHQLLATENSLAEHLAAFPSFLVSGTGAAIGKTLEATARHKDGHEIFISLSLSSVQHENKWNAVGIIRDITEIKRAESERIAMENVLKETAARLGKILWGITDTMTAIVERRDPYTAGHQRRVRDLACAIAELMGLPDDRMKCLRLAATVHDLGKVAVPIEILGLPRKLTPPELELMRSHPQVGYDILKDIDFDWPVAEVVYQHHERMDGSGYPRKLSGDQMLLEAKILAVSDVVEAISAHRPYRPGLGIEVALGEIQSNRGTLYDADVVDACMELFRTSGYRLEN